VDRAKRHTFGTDEGHLSAQKLEVAARPGIPRSTLESNSRAGDQRTALSRSRAEENALRRDQERTGVSFGNLGHRVSSLISIMIGPVKCRLVLYQ